MAKQLKAPKNAALLGQLLVKLQDRLTRVGQESSQNALEILALQDLDRTTRQVVGDLRVNANRQTAALIALRDSTLKAFGDVRKDVQDLLKLNQKLNERLGIAESQIATLTARLVKVEATAKEAIEFKHDLRRIVDNQRSGEPLNRGAEQGTPINDLWKGNSGGCVR